MIPFTLSRLIVVVKRPDALCAIVTDQAATELLFIIDSVSPESTKTGGVARPVQALFTVIKVEGRKTDG